MEKHLTAWVRKAGSNDVYTKISFLDCKNVREVYAKAARLGLEFDNTAIHWA